MKNTTRSRGDARELGLAEEVVVLGPSTLTLVDLDQDTGLVVGVGREDLRLLRGDGGVPLDESGHDTTCGLDTKRERCDIKQKEVLSLLRRIARENRCLDGSTVGDGLIGVDALVGLLAVEEVGHELNDVRNTG